MRKWMPALLVLAGYLMSAMLYSSLPSAMPFDFRALLPFGANGTVDLVPRTLGAFLIPTVALIMLLLLHEAPAGWLGRVTARVMTRMGGDAPPLEYHKFASSYRLIVAWVVSLVLSMHVAMLGVALGWSVQPGTIVGLVLGSGLIVIGNLIPRLRPNVIAGIRTPGTMRDPLLWARVHRLYGALWLAAGIAIVVVALASPRYAFATGVVALLLSSLAMLVALPALSAQRVPKT